MHIALQGPIAARGVRVEPTARVHRHVSGLLHRLDGEIPGRLDDDCSLATDPGNNGGPGFVIMAPARPALFSAPPRAGRPRLLSPPPPLGPFSRPGIQGIPLSP